MSHRCEAIVGNEDGQCMRTAVVRAVIEGEGSWHFYCRQHIHSMADNTERRLYVNELTTGEGWSA